MNILLTNDDGIHSEGLWAIAEKLCEIAAVTVVVPDRDQSGMGASMTLLKPLSYEQVEPRIAGVYSAYTVQGTPADCVIMATEHILESEPDLIVSGINQGANLGLDVFNSGTFGAALHGYFRGINSIAVSVLYKEDVIYGPSAIVGTILAQCMLDMTSEEKLLLNLNLPACQMSDIKAFDLTKLGPKAFLENVESMQSGRREYFWIRHNKPVNDNGLEGTDVWSVKNDRVSLTFVDPFLSTLNGCKLAGMFADVVRERLEIRN